MLTRRKWGQAMWGAAGAMASPWCRAMAETGDADARFADIAQRYFDDLMDKDPLFASSILALPKYEGQLVIDIAPESRARARALNARVAAELAQLPAASLGAAARLSHELLSWQIKDAQDGERFPDHLMPIDQYGGLPVTLANLSGGDQVQALKTVDDYDNFLKRLLYIPPFVTQAIANMREGMSHGIVVPRPLIVSALPTLRNLATPTMAASPFGAALRVMPSSFSNADRARIGRAYQNAYDQQIRPSLQRLTGFLQQTYMPACRTSTGLESLPDGEAWYAWQVRSHTTTHMTPDEIHALGLAEVARIQEEVAKLQPALGYRGDADSFLRWHESNPRFCPYKTWDEILAAYEKLNAKVEPLLPRLFGHVPAKRLAIRLIPELQRATTSPHYEGPSPDGTRPGIFFLGSPNGPAKYNSSGMTSLLLHEGQPGHHFQVCIQQEQDLPMFRRHGWHDAYGEGWALYAETLGTELGVYDDPNQRLGHLQAELHRAVRLVTDTGLHHQGWSRERTMRYMTDTQGLTEADARLSTERYMASPGQALAYKVGQMKITQLRKSAQQTLGQGFSLSAFHDRVLSQGSMPLDILEREIGQWMASQTAARLSIKPATGAAT